jgi:PAS domain S-box-containing protein
VKHHRRAWSVEKRREELRHHYEQVLRERSPNEIFMFDTDSLQLSFANDYALEDLGYTLEQLQNKTMLSLHPGASFQSFTKKLEQLRSNEQQPITYQTIQTRGNGSSYPVEVNLQLIKADDGGEKFLAIVHDITARKEVEENIQKLNAPVERRGEKSKM